MDDLRTYDIEDEDVPRLVPTLVTQHWFDPFELTPADLDPADMFLPLVHQARYAGATNFKLSPAQHCLHVADEVSRRDPAQEFPALMHDAEEAWLPDQLRPLLPSLPQWRAAKDLAHNAVADRFGLQRKFHLHPLILEADARMRVTEMLQLKGFIDPRDAKRGITPYDFRIPRLSDSAVMGLFVDRFFRLWKSPALIKVSELQQ